MPSYGHGRNSGFVAGVGRGAGLARSTVDHSLSDPAGAGRPRHRFRSRPAVRPFEPRVGPVDFPAALAFCSGMDDAMA